MTSPPSRRALVAVAVAVLVVTAAGLLWSPASHSGLSSSSAADEYRREALRLRLAPGWRWPATPPFPAKGPDGSPNSYGPHAGEIGADAHWFCSWANRAVTPGLGAAAHREALARLPKVRGTAFYAAFDPTDRAAFGAMVSRAVDGDLSGLRVHVRANCTR